MDEAAITAAWSGIPEWTRVGDTIERTYRFATFPDAIGFTRRVADAAEAANHHPDIDIRYRTVRLVWTTHDAGGLTDRDFQLARTCDRIASSSI